MGEIADAMLDGEFCPCGEYLGDGCGYPRYCSKACREAYGGGVETLHEEKLAAKPSCPHCGKKCKTEFGVQQHIRDKHPEKETPA